MTRCHMSIVVVVSNVSAVWLGASCRIEMLRSAEVERVAVAAWEVCIATYGAKAMR
jgi:hypothetical protein